MVEADQTEDIEFRWCKKRGLGGKKRDVQFYESFSFDGVEYSLYDSVYLYKEGEPEPYIGKLIKIWENPDKSKRVKVLWFFRPCEIQNYLGAEVVPENELFLASGEGLGLANINPLEAIAGKCNVICISKDERNREPIDEELKMADFIFYRTFDVGCQKISDKIDDQVAGTEAKLLLNKAGIYKFNDIVKDNTVIKKNEEEGNKAIAARDSSIIPSRVITCDKKGDVKEKATNVDISTNGETSSDSQLVKEICPLGKTSSAAMKNVFENGIQINGFSHEVEGKAKTIKGFDDDDRPLKRAKLDDKLSMEKDKARQESSTVDIHNKVKSVDEKDKINVKTSSTDVVSKEKASRQTMITQKDKSQLPNKSLQRDKDLSLPKLEEKSNFSNGKRLKKLSKPSLEDDKIEYQAKEVTRRPDLDKKTWFKELPFEDRIETAQGQGTLVLLRNLDPSHTSSEVEDIIWHGFQENCTAKMIQRTAISSPHSGRAFVIFRTREATEKALRKLDEGCLLLPNGRPLVGCLVDPSFISKQRTFHGHLVFNNPRQPNNRETKEAVSTSHCSQPNTIEYEMSMEWCLLQLRAERAWQMLYKQQGEELRKLKANFKSK